MLFVPTEIDIVANQAIPDHSLFVQLLGTAFIGFAAANWIIRHSPVGGICGRAIVIGNQVFSFTGTLTLLGSFPAAPGSGFWFLLIVLSGGTILYSMLLLRGS